MPKTKTKRAKPPGASYLVAAAGEAKYSDKCKCSSSGGAWRVVHDGQLYAFTHDTQMQKDIWLGAVKPKIGEDAAIAMLRWYCFTCNTVQMP